MKGFFTLYFLLYTTLCLASPYQFQDSSQIRINRLNEKARAQYDINPDSIRIFAQEALRLSNTIQYPKGKVEALNNLAFSSYLQGDYGDGLRYCENGLKLAKQHHLKRDMGNAYLYSGLININQGDFPAALNNFLPYLEISTKEEDLHAIADANSNIGLAYLKLHNTKMALSYYEEALHIHQQIEYPDGMVYVLLNLGKVHLDRKSYMVARQYLNTAVGLSKRLNSQRAFIHASTLFGLLSQMEGEFKSADKHYRVALNIADTLNLPFERANISYHLAKLHYNQSDYNDAIRFGNQALNIAETVESTTLMRNALNLLSHAFAAAQDLPQAKEFLRQYESLNDSISLKSHSTTMSAMMELYYLKGEEQKNKQLEAQIALKDVRIKLDKYLLAGGAFAVLCISVIALLLFRMYKHKSKANSILAVLNQKIEQQKASLKTANENLAKLNDEKDMLLGVVAHDLRSPLNRIEGLLRLMDLEQGLSERQQKYTRVMRRTVDDAQDLTNSLLAINSFENGQLNISPVNVDLHQLISEIRLNYAGISKRKNIALEVLIDEISDDFNTDDVILRRIIDNLISNAFKFSERNTRITMQVALKDHRMSFILSDQGPGISVEDQSKMFKKFSKLSAQPTHNESSNGLGLYIVNNLIMELSGEIKVCSALGKGTIFRVSIPDQRYLFQNPIAAQ